MMPEPNSILSAAGLEEELASLLAAGGDEPTPLERQLLGALADPAARRAVEDLAERNRRAVQAGATEASEYEEGRVPEVGGEVIFRGAPARVLDVKDAGDPMSRLDLLQYRGGRPEAFSAVVHDRDNGWHWLGEPPPPEPGPEDRIRAALASGKPAIPSVGSVVRLMRAKPPSFRGVEMIALRAEVVARVDVVGAVVTLDLRVIEPPVDGLDPATCSGTVCGVPGPMDEDPRREGWSTSARPSLYIEPDDRTFDHLPCQRCGAKLRHDERVKFSSKIWDDRNPRDFAVHCRTCADQFGRLAFGPAALGESPL